MSSRIAYNSKEVELLARLIKAEALGEGQSTLIPPKNPNPAAVPQIYMGNIIRLNIGKLGTFYFTYSDSEKWRDEVFVGIVEDAGRDYFIIKDVNSEDRFLLPLVYFLWARFKGAISFTVPPQ